MRATRFLGPALLASCSNLARVLPDAPTGEPPARPPEALARPRDPSARAPEAVRLASGLTALLVCEPGEPRVALELRFACGLRDESSASAGAALDFARRLAEPRDPDLARRLETAGAWIVAQAGLDDTRLVALAPRAALAELLALAAEELDGSAVPGPLAVPRAPREASERALWEALYPPDHPYRLAAPAPELGEVARFQRAHFVPAAARLVLSGGFEPAAARARLEQVFGALAPLAPPARRNPPPPALAAPVRLEFEADLERPELALVWHSPARHAPLDAELDLAAALLAEGASARLAQRLVLDTRLAEEVAASQQDAALSSLFRIDVRTAPGTDLAAVEREVLAVLDELARSGPGPDELAHARERALAREKLRLAGLLARTAAAQELLASRGRADVQHALEQRWQDASAEGVRTALEELVRAPHVTLVRRPRE